MRIELIFFSLFDFSWKQAGTVFSEGLVQYRNKWFLYYGTADSYVGVAVSDLPLKKQMINR